jgi:hypothetical protein
MNHGELLFHHHFEPLASHFIASRRVWWWAQIWAQPGEHIQAPENPVRSSHVTHARDNFFENQDSLNAAKFFLIGLAQEVSSDRTLPLHVLGLGARVRISG